jgi:CrcB protein
VTALLVALAGAAGVLARYGLGHALGPGVVPWGVVGINVAGSLALGALVGAGVGAQTRAIAGVGFLGGFTTFSTFSTFSMDVVADLDAGRPGRAALVVGASVVLGVAAAALGYVVASRG